MKITRRQLRRIIREGYSKIKRDQLIRESFNVRAGDPLAMEIISIAKDAIAQGKPGISYKDLEYSFYENAELDEFEYIDDYEDIEFIAYMDAMDIISLLEYMASQGMLRVVASGVFAPAGPLGENRQIRESAETADFPPVSHPVIAPYFNEEKYHNKEGTGWAKEYKTYIYKHTGGTSGKQDLVIYLRNNGTYMARIFGAYNNRISNDDKGEHPDPISAVEAALNSAPGGRPPFAKDLLTKVGEEHKGLTGNVPMYD